MVNSLPSSHRVSGRHPSGRRRLAGEGEKRAGSGRVAPRTRPDPGAAGEGDAPHPMQNSEIKIHGCRAAMLSIVSALFAGIGGDSTGGN